jgi:hypothetical protein
VYSALSVIAVSLRQFFVPRIANVLLVYYATVIGPSCFIATEVGFVALGFVAIV